MAEAFKRNGTGDTAIDRETEGVGERRGEERRGAADRSTPQTSLPFGGERGDESPWMQLCGR